jgi:hypothetical protein
MKIPRPNTKAMDWPETDGRGVYPGEVVTHREVHDVVPLPPYFILTCPFHCNKGSFCQVEPKTLTELGP